MFCGKIFKSSGCSAVGSARLWEVEAAGSNPVTPTIANCPPNGLLNCLAGIFIFVFSDVYQMYFAAFLRIFSQAWVSAWVSSYALKLFLS